MYVSVYRLTIWIAALLVSVSMACAAPVFYEGFGYSVGSTVGNEGGWTTGSGYNGFDILAPGGSYTDSGGRVLDVSGNHAYTQFDLSVLPWSARKRNMVTKTLPQGVTDLLAANGTVYMSLLLKENVSVSVLANPDTPNQRAFSIGTGVATTDHYYLSVGMQQNVYPNAISVDASSWPAMYWNWTSWAFIAVKIVMRDGNDEITVIRNPASILSPAWETPSYSRLRVDTLDISSPAYSQIRISGNGGNSSWAEEEHVGGIDEIRIASTWAGALESGAGSVTGVVVPEGYSGDVSDVGLRIEFRQSGVPIITKKVFPDGQGNFAVDNIPPDTYDVAIRAPSWLQEVLTDQVVSGVTNLGTITLKAGDVDGSSEVNSTDLSAVLKNVGTDGDQ